jgi:hypothetical protein
MAVIPANAGIQECLIVTKSLDPGCRRGDDHLPTVKGWAGRSRSRKRIPAAIEPGEEKQEDEDI